MTIRIYWWLNACYFNIIGHVYWAITISTFIFCSIYIEILIFFLKNNQIHSDESYQAKEKAIHLTNIYQLITNILKTHSPGHHKLTPKQSHTKPYSIMLLMFSNFSVWFPKIANWPIKEKSLQKENTERVWNLILKLWGYSWNYYRFHSYMLSGIYWEFRLIIFDHHKS